MTRLLLRLRVPLALPLVLGALALTGCDGDDPNPTNDVILFGVNFTRLLDTPPTDAERQQVLAEWAARNPAPVAVQVEAEGTDTGGARLVVLSHQMTDPDGTPFRHYGVVRIPFEAADLPVVVVNHGGDDGFDLASTLDLLDGYPAVYGQVVLVMPTFRAEPLTTAGVAGLGGSFSSGGAPSPWDYDVDDALALMEAALQQFPAETDETRLGAIGYSRGGDVALLMGVRDDRVDVVTDYFGPTDFFDDSLRPLALGLLGGDPAALAYPGALYILEHVLRPLQGPGGTHNPDADYAAARLEVLRRSPAYFTDRLPNLQVHHHQQDPTVPIEQAQALDAAVRDRPNDGAYDFNVYSNALPAGVPSAHSAYAMPESFADTDAFFEAHLLAPALAGTWGD